MRFEICLSQGELNPREPFLTTRLKSGGFCNSPDIISIFLMFFAIHANYQFPMLKEGIGFVVSWCTQETGSCMFTMLWWMHTSHILIGSGTETLLPFLQLVTGLWGSKSHLLISLSLSGPIHAELFHAKWSSLRREWKHLLPTHQTSPQELGAFWLEDLVHKHLWDCARVSHHQGGGSAAQAKGGRKDSSLFWDLVLVCVFGFFIQTKEWVVKFQEHT